VPPAPSPFSMPLASAHYPEFGLYAIRREMPCPWEFRGWKPESLSWKTGCYIHGGLSGRGSQVRYRGRQAAEFLASICINNFSRFRPGAAKHAVMCTDKGLIAAHGVLQRIADDEFRLFASGPWAPYMHSKTRFDVEQVVEDRYLFQVAGPTSLQVLETATGESLRDIGFLRFRDSKIGGKSVQVMRIGMAGTLAYELHGPTSDGPEVYDAVFEAGRAFSLERLGWQTYPVNHVEGGFPQANWTFLGAAHDDSGFLNHPDKLRWMPPDVTGSIDPGNMRARYRTPVEVGWERSVQLDHDFQGRDAIERELVDPRKTIVTLIWNADDVLDVYASLFRDGREYKTFELPTTPHFRRMIAHADDVVHDRKSVGVSSGTTYSYHFRKMISLCTIDRDCAGIGTELTVKWGDFGGPIKDIRASVARFPYLQEERNQDVDVATMHSAGVA